MMSRASVATMPPMPPAASEPESVRAAKVLIRNVEFYCGKSTLLRVLNRIYELYPGQRATGEVLVDGENILAPGRDLNLLRAKIGMVFQKPTPFPMSIRDNIAFGIRLYERLSQAELDERIEAALRRAALWDEVKD